MSEKENIPNQFYQINRMRKRTSTLKAFLVCILFALCSTFVMAQTDTTITTFNNVHQGNGSGLATRTVVDTFPMPSDLSIYSQIKLHILLSCPTGGCDPWDRFASVSAWHNGEWFEIGRYMTPYGRSCGWVIDVSDYRSMFKDTLILQSFIDTWTNPGWLVKYDFEFIAGTPAYTDIKVENLWLNYNVVYGDTTQPVNVPDVITTIDANADSVKMKMVNTGHGQGNTNNAAEFSQKTHSLKVNGNVAANQLLWRGNCSTNPCQPQNGTWQYNRAGWCPGADVLPYKYDITSLVVPGQPVTLGYQLQSYFNLCSPNNPGCTSATCADCNYNYNGHTEPHYKISGQLITYLNAPTGVTDLNSYVRINITPNPSNGLFTINIKGAKQPYTIDMFDVIGKKVWTGNGNSAQQTINLSGAGKGVYFVKLHGQQLNKTQKVVVQ